MSSAGSRLAALAAILVTGAGIAACSTSPSSSPSSSATTSAAAPVSGGTLRIVAASGPEHLDTVPSYYTADYQLTRAFTRQLLSYPTLPYTSTSSANWVKDTTPTADVATQVPSVANGGITNGGKTYTFHIKPGVDWNTTPPRQVTSQDFLREFKAFFNPVSPVGNPTYYNSTIAGLSGVRRGRDRVLRQRQGAPAHRRQHRALPGHTRHRGHCHPEPRDDPVHADEASQRLPLHDGDAVHLGPADRVRQLRAEQPPARPAHDLGRALPDQLLRPGQVDHDGARPGLEAVDRHPAARLRK